MQKYIFLHNYFICKFADNYLNLLLGIYSCNFLLQSTKTFML